MLTRIEMENEFELGTALERLIKSMNRAKTLIDGKVTAVNDDFTCDIEINEVPFSGVPVKVLIGSRASIYEIPVVDTGCLVTFRDGDMQRPQIFSFNEVDQYFIDVNNMKINIAEELDIDADQTVFNGGGLGGLVKLTPSLQAFNSLQNDINELKAAFNAWVVIPNDGGAGLKASSAAWAASDVPVTTQAQIENTKITQ
jgi:hypothetical protein